MSLDCILFSLSAENMFLCGTGKISLPYSLKTILKLERKIQIYPWMIFPLNGLPLIKVDLIRAIE